MVLQGEFVKSGILLNLKAFLWNSYRTGDPEKIKAPQKIARKWTFLSLAFYNAPSLHTVKCSFMCCLGFPHQKILWVRCRALARESRILKAFRLGLSAPKSCCPLEGLALEGVSQQCCRKSRLKESLSCEQYRLQPKQHNVNAT